MSDREPVGFLPCKKCQSLKYIYQGQGKRARFLYAKCDCGLDQRTGAPVQNAFAKHVTKEDAQAQLDALNTPTETPPKPKDDDKESGSAAPWVIAGLIGVFGLLKLRG